ncbi:MAG: WD40 repeat domain-containing protein [Planctomycetota bacterium]|nr:WD40 repeat domain-containing protein [Planctomycetota bacterium]
MVITSVLAAQETLNQIDVTHRIKITGTPTRLALSPDGAKVGILSLLPGLPAASGVNGNLTLWNLGSKQSSSVTLDLKSTIYGDLAFTPSGERLVVLEKHQVRLFDPNSQKFGAAVKGEMVRLVGNSIVLAEPLEGGTSKIVVYDLESLKPRFTAEFKNLRICDLSPDEMFLLCSDGRKLCFHAIESRTSLPELEIASDLISAAIAPGGKHTAISTESSGAGHLEIYNWDVANKTATLHSRLDTSAIGKCREVRFITESILALSRPNNILFWNFKEKREVTMAGVGRQLSGSKSQLSDKTVNTLAITTPNSVHLYDENVGNLSVSVTLPERNLLSHSNNGHIIATLNESNEVEIGRVRMQVENLTLISKTVYPYPKLGNFKLDLMNCLFSDNNETACVYGIMPTDHQVLGIFETSTAKQIEIKPPTGPYQRRTPHPIVYFDSKKQTFNFLSNVGIDNPRNMQAQYNWLSVSVNAQNSVYKKASFFSPPRYSIRYASSPFKLGDGRLAVIVYGFMNSSVASSEDTYPLYVADLPSGKVIKMFSKNLPNVRDLKSLSGPDDIIVSQNAEFASLHVGQMQNNGSPIEQILSWKVESGDSAGEPVLGSHGAMFGFSGETLCADANASNLSKDVIQFSDLKTQRLLNSVKLPGTVVVAPHADRFLYGGPDGEVMWGDLKSGKTISVASPHSTRLHRGFFSRDGKLLLTVAKVDTSIRSDVELRFWRTPPTQNVEPVEAITLQP